MISFRTIFRHLFYLFRDLTKASVMILPQRVRIKPRVYPGFQPDMAPGRWVHCRAAPILDDTLGVLKPYVQRTPAGAISPSVRDAPRYCILAA